ncbi:MarR family transcriptional regulator [Streptomyces sp. NBC_01318]|uniref:LexA family protein n=1 Tax=Streptomyces sp. NBC_01318 TaxID=2903823 RepID=UPI002E12AF28|nr:MarR family transcriptional regulator [Streptomyces sp. NBC_01318]
MCTHKYVHNLTDRQRRILAAIRDHIAETGEAPTVREIGAAVGLSSSSSVLYQLRRLEQAGVLARERYRSRSVRMS